jgi:glycosyltransferase involved in cell wall biosynthesis
MNPSNNLTIVIIGRNEGQRLIACLNSLKLSLPNIIYVDSASTDDSVNSAKVFGAYVVSLDMTKPFTAARARNAGAKQAEILFPNTEFLQFIDGDCEVAPNWLLQASNFLKTNQEVAVVCGRRREKYPKASVYNMLCDYEWNTPVGEAKACGGDALMRKSVFYDLGGFRESLIAGEEPELCVRIRKKGYKIWRLDAEMTLHDVNMMHFKQWWLRTMRGGYAFAEGSYLHGAAPEHHWVLESRRAWLWGLIIPFIILILAVVKPIWAIFLLLIYPLQWLRLSLKTTHSFKDASLYAFFLIIGKFAEAVGQIKFLLNRYSRKQSKIIEYR